MVRGVVLAVAVVLLSTPVGLASDYVPGRTRDGGVYVPPHFQGPDHRVHPAEAWFDALQRDKALLEPDKEGVPGSAGSPPAPPAAADRHR